MESHPIQANLTDTAKSVLRLFSFQRALVKTTNFAPHPVLTDETRKNSTVRHVLRFPLHHLLLHFIRHVPENVQIPVAHGLVSDHLALEREGTLFLKSSELREANAK